MYNLCATSPAGDETRRVLAKSESVKTGKLCNALPINELVSDGRVFTLHVVYVRQPVTRIASANEWDNRAGNTPSSLLTQSKP